MRDIESCDLSRIYRVSLSRANILSSTTTLYAKPRDWSVQMGDTNRIWFKPNSTASVDSQGAGVWSSLCALRVGAAFDRSRYNQSERRQSFFSILTYDLSETYRRKSLRIPP